MLTNLMNTLDPKPAGETKKQTNEVDPPAKPSRNCKRNNLPFRNITCPKAASEAASAEMCSEEDGQQLTASAAAMHKAQVALFQRPS